MNVIEAEIFGVAIIGNEISIAYIRTGVVPQVLTDLLLPNLVQDVASNLLPLKSLDFRKNATFEAVGNVLETSVR